MFNCGVVADFISVDFNSNTGALHLSGGRIPDMGKTIASFTAINKDIKAIDTFIDGNPDTRYLYVASVEDWQAFPPFKFVFGEIK